MSNTYILPQVVFALVPGMGTVFSKRTAPSLPWPSIEDASVVSIAAAKMLIAVHNNVRPLNIALLPICFCRASSRLWESIVLFEDGFKTLSSFGNVVFGNVVE